MKTYFLKKILKEGLEFEGIKEIMKTLVDMCEVGMNVARRRQRATTS